MEFLGIGGSELMLLIVLGVIMFGPEKLPELSRKAARVVHVVRLFADRATDQLREELGPEYKDLKLTDLNPKTFVRKTLLADIEDDLNDIKAELDGVRSDLSSSAADINSAGRSATTTPRPGPGSTGGESAGAGAVAAVPGSAIGGTATKTGPPAVPPLSWDPEAT